MTKMICSGSSVLIHHKVVHDRHTPYHLKFSDVDARECTGLLTFTGHKEAGWVTLILEESWKRWNGSRHQSKGASMTLTRSEVEVLYQKLGEVLGK